MSKFWNQPLDSLVQYVNQKNPTLFEDAINYKDRRAKFHQLFVNHLPVDKQKYEQLYDHFDRLWAKENALYGEPIPVPVSTLQSDPRIVKLLEQKKSPEEQLETFRSLYEGLPGVYRSKKEIEPAVWRARLFSEFQKLSKSSVAQAPKALAQRSEMEAVRDAMVKGESITFDSKNLRIAGFVEPFTANTYTILYTSREAQTHAFEKSLRASFERFAPSQKVNVEFLVNDQTDQKTGKLLPTIYEQLGGFYVISKVVDEFSNRVVANDVVGKKSENKYLHEWSNKFASSRLAGLKHKRTDWLCAVAGGREPFETAAPGKCPFSLEKIHKPFEITSEQFDVVALILKGTLQDFQVPSNLIDQVVGVFNAHKSEVVNQQPPTECPRSAASSPFVLV